MYKWFQMLKRHSEKSDIRMTQDNRARMKSFLHAAVSAYKKVKNICSISTLAFQSKKKYAAVESRGKEIKAVCVSFSWRG